MFQFVPKRGSETGVPKSLLTRFDLFKKRPELVASGRYTIKSDVDPDVFALLMTRVYGGHSDVGVTRENAEQLRTLCDELGFSEFDDEIRGVLGCGDWKVRKEIAGVRDRVDRHDVLIEQLQRRVLELERRLQEVPQRVEVVEMRLQETDRGLDGPRNGVREGVEKLRREVRGGVADARAVSEEAKRLKEAEAKRAMAAPPPPCPVARPAPAAKTPGDVQGQVVGEFVYDKASPLEGIIAHLTRECGENVQEAGIVEVTASRCIGGLPENVAELGTNSYFQSGREPDSWIRYDFKERRVTPTSYSVRTDGGCSQPRSWVLEISNDGSDGSWDVVDRRDDNFLLNASRATRNFAISAPASGSFRFVRLRQTGKNHGGYDDLCLTSLEVFGTLFSQ